MLTAASELGVPYLVIHAKDDDVVSFENGEALFAAAGDYGEMLAMESGGHLLGPRPAAEAALDAVVKFLDRQN